MEEIIDSSIKVITSWDYDTSDISPNTSLFNHHSREEVLEFMRAVKDLHSAIQSLTMSPNSNVNISYKKMISCQNVLHVAKKRLSSEFFSLLKANSKHHIHQFSDTDDQSVSSSSSSHHDPTSGSTNSNHAVFTASNTIPENIPSATEEASSMADLKLIVDCMMSAGFGKKCFKIYKLTRRSFVEDALLKLGARRLKKAQVEKLDWETIDSKMSQWFKTCNVCVKIFAHEKNLCEHLFSSCTLSSVTETCFSEVCKEAAPTVVRIPGKLAKHVIKKSPDKICKYLKLYEEIIQVSPDIDRVFSSEMSSPVRSELRNSITRVSEAVKAMLTDFEASIQKDASKVVVPGGGTHPLSKHVINYMINLSEHAGSLDKILIDYPVSLQPPLPESYFEGEHLTSPVALQFAWLILVLLGKLDTKSELYKDVALSYLFLANNLQYVVKRVKSTKLYNVLGEKWINKHTSKVLQYAANYERMGWGRVISALPKDLTMEMSLDKVKECFKRFNADFEEEYRKQVDWIVHDTKLRDEMKATIARKVDARYRKMYDKYKVVLAKSRERGKVDSVLKFTPEDLENYLSDLLDGHEDDNDDSSSYTMENAESTSSHDGKDDPFLQRRTRRLLLMVRQHHQ